MNELLTMNVNENNDMTFSAREIHKGVEATERFGSWFGRMLQYGFEENIDYTSVKSFTVVNNGAKRELQDYALTLDMAKEVCMLQRNEKGSQYRKYLIRIEKEWNSPEKVMARALLMAQKSLEIMKPKAEYYDLVLTGEGKYTATEIGAEFGMTAKTLHEILHSLKMIKKVGGQWIPTKKYSNMDLMQSETQSVNNINILTWKWTEEGRKFVVEILRGQGYTTIQESKQGNF